MGDREKTPRLAAPAGHPSLGPFDSMACEDRDSKHAGRVRIKVEEPASPAMNRAKDAFWLEHSASRRIN